MTYKIEDRNQMKRWLSRYRSMEILHIHTHKKLMALEKEAGFDEAKEALRQTMANASRVCAEISRAIDSLEDSKERTVLELRYIAHYKREVQRGDQTNTISYQMCYSPMQCHRIHQRALDRLMEKLNSTEIQ